MADGAEPWLRHKQVAANGFVAGLESAGEKGGGISGLREEKVREGRPPWPGATPGGGGATMERRADRGAAAAMDWRGGWGRAATMAAMNGGCGRRGIDP
jgi:hypothetical protein